MQEQTPSNGVHEFKLTPPPEHSLNFELKRIIRASKGLILPIQVVRQAIEEEHITDDLIYTRGIKGFVADTKTIMRALRDQDRLPVYGLSDEKDDETQERYWKARVQWTQHEFRFNLAIRHEQMERDQALFDHLADEYAERFGELYEFQETDFPEDFQHRAPQAQSGDESEE